MPSILVGHEEKNRRKNRSATGSLPETHSLPYAVRQAACGACTRPAPQRLPCPASRAPAAAMGRWRHEKPAVPGLASEEAA